MIGRNSAVGVMGKLQVSGFLAWLAWSGIHLWYLVEFDNRLLVFLQRSWSYFTRKQGARLITEPAEKPVDQNSDGIQRNTLSKVTEPLSPPPKHSNHRAA